VALEKEIIKGGEGEFHYRWGNLKVRARMAKLCRKSCKMVDTSSGDRVVERMKNSAQRNPFDVSEERECRMGQVVDWELEQREKKEEKCVEIKLHGKCISKDVNRAEVPSAAEAWRPEERKEAVL